MGAETKKGVSQADDRGASERTLIYIPIVHTQADMGGLGESIQRLKVKRLGKRGWERNVSLVGQLWAQNERAVQRQDLPFERVRLYQDGLPICGRELEIVKELASAKSRNHQLLLRLSEKGATIMGTESSELLVEEYQLVKGVFASGNPEFAGGEGARQRALRDSLLIRRDQYIARRINDTLRMGETGLIFLGMLHSLGPWLDKDIRVVYPIHIPPTRGVKGP